MRLILNSLRTVLASGASYAFLAFLAHGSASAQARKIELGDLQKIVGVSNPAISPDGKSIAIIVSRVNWDEDRNDKQLVLVDIASGGQRRLTNIRKGSDSSGRPPATGSRSLRKLGKKRRPPRKSLCCP